MLSIPDSGSVFDGLAGEGVPLLVHDGGIDDAIDAAKLGSAHKVYVRVYVGLGAAIFKLLNQDLTLGLG
jgi:hypothetical protein